MPKIEVHIQFGLECVCDKKLAEERERERDREIERERESMFWPLISPCFHGDSYLSATHMPPSWQGRRTGEEGGGREIGRAHV